MISQRLGNGRFRNELRAAIIELEWLGHHAGCLSSQEVSRRLRNSIERQKELVRHFEKNHASSLEENELDEELKALCSAQRHGILQIIRTFGLPWFVDCSSRIGKGNVTPLALRVRPGMETSSS